MRTTLAMVVPRTIESSTRTTRLPASTARFGLCFIRTDSSRASWLGWMKVRPRWWLRMMPISKGIPAAWAKPSAAGTPESGTGTTTSAATRLSSARR